MNPVWTAWSPPTATRSRRPPSFQADHAVTGVGDTPNPVRDQYRVKADGAYDHTLTLRPLDVGASAHTGTGGK
ncbi:hypothetical protein AB0D24_36080 [Streptomyces javensis]|uniref:hypothetical protein n=1 Tax=Streptomyces javensis TaxID=114698 RepID=UPI0033EE68A2